MPRPSKSAERLMLRRYAEAAGGRDALIGWIDEALSETKPQRGRKRYKERYSIATLERLFEAKPKDRARIFEQLIDEGRIGGIGQCALHLLIAQIFWPGPSAWLRTAAQAWRWSTSPYIACVRVGVWFRSAPRLSSRLVRLDRQPPRHNDAA